MNNASQTQPQPNHAIPEPALFAQSWNLPLCILFRFVCSYLVLYAAPARERLSLISAIPGGSFLASNWTVYRSVYVHPDQPPIYGLYRVEAFQRSGREIPPLATDGTRWDWVAAQNPQGLIVLAMDGSGTFYRTRYDAPRNRVLIVIRGTEYALMYSHSDADHLLLEGKLQADLLSVRLRKVDPSTFLLASRGFHWINELPFNR